jgi:hypothetical protein
VAAGRAQRLRCGCDGGLRRRADRRARPGRGHVAVGNRHPVGAAGRPGVQLASGATTGACQPRRDHLCRRGRPDAGHAEAHRLGGFRRSGGGPGRVRPGLADGAGSLPGGRGRRDVGGVATPARARCAGQRDRVRGPAVRRARGVPDPDAGGGVPGRGGPDGRCGGRRHDHLAAARRGSASPRDQAGDRGRRQRGGRAARGHRPPVAGDDAGRVLGRRSRLTRGARYRRSRGCRRSGWPGCGPGSRSWRRSG